jgi:hypothetical protein
MTSGNSVTGQIGKGVSLNGTSNYISTPNSVNPGTFTVSAWVKTTSTTGTKVIGFETNQTGTSSAHNDRQIWIGTDGKAHFGCYSGGYVQVASSASVNNGSWHYLVGEFTGSALTLYVDGAQAATTAISSCYSETGYWRIGSYKDAGWTAGADGYFTGTVDETRISTTARSATWISTEWNNQNSPSTFYSLAAAEGAPDVTPPNAFAISSPAAAATIANGQTVSSSPTDNVGVASVAYSYCAGSSCTFATGTAIGTATSGPTFSVTWISQPANGTYTLIARATDAAGNYTDSSTTTVTVSNATIPWYDPGWLYRKAITIDHTKVTATQTSFPVLVNLASDASLAANAQASGNDILFTASDGVTKLSDDVDQYTAATGALAAWVSIPTLSNTADTVIYMYYGNAAATNQETPASVWTPNYYAVWHLGDNPGGTAPQFVDGTGNNTATAQGSMTSGNSVAGEIGNAVSLNGTSNYISTPNSVNPGTFTISAWVKTTSTAGTKVMGFETNQTGTGSAHNDRQIWIGTDGKAHFGCYSGGFVQVASPSAVNNGSWHYLVGEFTGSALTLYVDGSQAATTAISACFNETGYWRIGSYKAASWTAGADGYFAGTIDEARISTTARSSTWISTEWANQSSPSTFYSLGSATAQLCTGGGLTLTAPSAITWSVTLDGTDQTAAASLIVTTDDETSTHTGWDVTGTSTTFTNGGSKTLPTTATTLATASSASATGNCSLPTNAITYPLTLPAGATAPTAVKLFNAAANTGRGPSTVTFGFQIAALANIYTGTYTSTWTISMVSGP